MADLSVVEAGGIGREEAFGRQKLKISVPGGITIPRRKARAPSAGPTPDHGRYGWPIKLMCWVVVIAYVLAGVAKLKNGGMSWIWGDELRNHVALDNARKILLGGGR